VPSAEYDLRYLQAGLEELEDYLTSGGLYWSVGVQPPTGEPSYPSLTIGNLLLALERLRGKVLPPDVEADRVMIERHLTQTRNRWRTAWGSKAHRELRARLNLWRDFLEEYRRDPGANIDRYAYEVHRRVELELLWREVDAILIQDQEFLSGLDRILEAVFVKGEFIWEPAIQNAFPPQPYWYLYGKPRV
jgi:hypothetical protein